MGARLHAVSELLKLADLPVKNLVKIWMQLPQQNAWSIKVHLKTCQGRLIWPVKSEMFKVYLWPEVGRIGPHRLPSPDHLISISFRAFSWHCQGGDHYWRVNWCKDLDEARCVLHYHWREWLCPKPQVSKHLTLNGMTFTNIHNGWSSTCWRQLSLNGKVFSSRNYRAQNCLQVDKKRDYM